MCSSSVVTVSLCLLMCLPPCLSSDVTVKPGEDATLQCQSTIDDEIAVIKWNKPGLESEGYIFFYRENRPIEDHQHPSYRGRVELIDPEMKDGNVSVVLKNVTTNDTGRYECHIRNTGSVLQFTRGINLTVTDSVNITDKPGQSVSLPCRAPSNTDIVVVNWTRPGLKPEYVLKYRSKDIDPHNQLPSYQNRVELKDREMKDGDVSMILKNVKRDDTGTYESRVIHKETNSSSGSSSGLFSTVHLEVHQPGDKGGRGDKDGGNKGLHIGLPVTLFVVAAVGGVVGFIVYRKRRKLTEQSSPEVRYTAAKTDQPADDAVRVEIH